MQRRRPTAGWFRGDVDDRADHAAFDLLKGSSEQRSGDADEQARLDIALVGEVEVREADGHVERVEAHGAARCESHDGHAHPVGESSVLAFRVGEGQPPAGPVEAVLPVRPAFHERRLGEAGFAHHEDVGVGDQAGAVDLERVPTERCFPRCEVGSEQWPDGGERRLDRGRVDRADVCGGGPVAGHGEFATATRRRRRTDSRSDSRSHQNGSRDRPRPIGRAAARPMSIRPQSGRSITR